MPYNPDGSFTLLFPFGTATAPDNQFPNQVGLDLQDIADGIDLANIISEAAFYNNVLTVNHSTTSTVGYLFTSYNAGSFGGTTYTPNAANGNYQYLTNAAAFTWGPPSFDSAIDVLVTNGPSAGPPTFSGYTVASGNTGDSYTTANGNKFIVSIRRINGVSTYVIKALQ